MGEIYATAAVRNPAQPDRAWEGLFLVDTGAIDCVIPREHLESVGLEPRGQRRYVLADGSDVRMDVTVGEIELMDRVVGCTIVFGQVNSEPLLGLTAMESAGVKVDPRNQELRRLRCIRL